ncbi:uncharacterized protein [Chironomus tepperi]|uniref:uncharacterized protein n=1 Tax=Chironomus tepperi TaxID=113505 RepID=UPI00391EF117
MIFKFLLIAVFINGIVARYRLTAHECIGVHGRLVSPNGCFELSMQEDGNLVAYRRSNREPIWHTGTSKTCTERACMQGDGNFVTYDCHHSVTWSSGTANNYGAIVQMQDDGNIVAYDLGKAIWASSSQTNC